MLISRFIWQVKANNRLKNMTNLLYWYGAYDDVKNAYSFVASSKLVSYENGLKKGYNKPSKAIQKKIDEGKKLSPAQEQLLKGLEEMREDKEKDPEDRRGKMQSDFSEAYDTDSELDEELDEEPDEEPDEEVEEELEGGLEEGEVSIKVTEKIKTKATKGKKKIKDEIEEIVSETDEIVPANVKKRKKAVASDEIGEPKSKRGKQGTMKTEEKKDLLQSEVEPIERGYKVTRLDRSPDKDEDSEEDASIVSESDDDDADFEISTTYKNKPKKKVQPKELKKPPKKKRVKAKRKFEKKATKEERNAYLKRMEQLRFEESETQFLDFIKAWKEVVAQERVDFEQLDFILHKVSFFVEEMSSSFMVFYDIAGLLKKSKIFPELENKRKALKTKFRIAYDNKRKLVPDGFRPVRRKPKAIEKKASAKQETPKETKVEGLTAADSIRIKAFDSAKEKVPSTSTEPSSPLKRIDSKVKVEQDAPSSSLKSTPTAKEEALSTSNEPSSTLKRIGSKEKVEQDALSSSLKPAVARVSEQRKKKGFLGNLMQRPSSSAPKLVTKTVTEKKVAPVQPSRPQKIPTWISESIKTEQLQDENRSFALEFLQQVAPFIPQKNNVNHDTIARALEAAIFEWASGKAGETSDWVNKYWEKVDDLVASISGNHGVGTIAAMIAEGKFGTPGEIVRLSDEAILSSFHSKPLKS